MNDMNPLILAAIVALVLFLFDKFSSKPSNGERRRSGTNKSDSRDFTNNDGRHDSYRRHRDRDSYDDY